ncbi:GNAT family N-acetyltransferase [Xanthomonas campestris pv. campestris]|uniref:GNAT family N-acetyltransferase n=1 Tax=Xanthomonas campestris TaxID=339 RepID=UPI0025A2091C|nr:GNAT family N-acetyltransferase [Xanthomonas campestris]MDM7696048.1 GNAT family N-acetyltransferase [Xanthomonas campestris pv. campestris]
MPSMADPSRALASFQEAFAAGGLRLERGRVDPTVYLHVDHLQGQARFTYVHLDGQTVSAFASFVPNGTFEGHPNLAVGYAVSDGYRNQGCAKAILTAGIAEMQNGFRGHPPFYIEAVVSANNPASQKVAQEVLGGEPEPMVDNHSGEPALRYAKLFSTAK